MRADNTPTFHLRVRLTEVGLPPIHDGLVVGREAPIGCSAIRKALGLVSSIEYEHIELDDEVISNILVRAQLMRRLPREKLVSFVLERIKPLMAPDDILHIDSLDLEITI